MESTSNEHLEEHSESDEKYVHPLHELRIENFKSIKSSSVRLAGLTAVVGANSAGKSSLLHSLVALSQGAAEQDVGAFFPLVGRKIPLGSFDDVLHDHADRKRIRLGVTYLPSIHDDGQGNRSGPPQALIKWDLELGPTLSKSASLAEIRKFDYQVDISPIGLRPGLIEVKATPPAHLQGRAHLVPVRSGSSRDHRRKFLSGSSTRIDFVRLVGGIPAGAFAVRELWELLFEHAVAAASDNRRIFASEAQKIQDVKRADSVAAVAKVIVSAADKLDSDDLEQLERIASPRLEGTMRNQVIDIGQRVVMPELFKRPSDEVLRAVAGLTRHASYNRRLWVERADQEMSATRFGIEISPEQAERLRRRVVASMTGFHHVDLELSGQRYLREFLSAVRYLGPLRSSPARRGIAGVSRTDVGIQGEHAFAALHHNQTEIIVPPLSAAVAFNEAPTLGQVVNRWLAYIGVASSVETTDNSRDGIGLSAVREPGGRAFDLTELGVGVSQVLPVVLTCLLTRPGEVVAIEQPELHLHPALQIRLAEFLIACAKSGRQVLVESHSEYLVNRLRRHVVENPGDGDLIQLLFAEQDESGGTHYRESAVRPDGTLEDDWPSGFLDVGADEAFQLLKAHVGQESRA